MRGSGSPSHFLYDRARNLLQAYRLASAEARVYTAIVPNRGLYESRVLGLDVQVDKDRLRFYAGTELLLESAELIPRIQARALEAQRQAEDAQRQAEEEARLRQEEARLREQAERLRDEEARRREEAERLRAEAEQRREEERRLREEETRRREEAEQEVARLRAELERLKR
jgi:flagellar biosynthesis GTPase FlhF